jgi:hypothetical protein
MLARARAYTAERAAEHKAARDKRKGRCEHCRESMPVQRGTRKTRRFWRSASDAPRKEQGGSGAVGLSDRTKYIRSNLNLKRRLALFLLRNCNYLHLSRLCRDTHLA